METDPISETVWIFVTADNEQGAKYNSRKLEYFVFRIL
jgi:hypothetical protein